MVLSLRHVLYKGMPPAFPPTLSPFSETTTAFANANNIAITATVPLLSTPASSPSIHSSYLSSSTHAVARPLDVA